MSAVVDQLRAAIHADPIFRRRVQNYVRTAPNTHDAGIAFRYLREYPTMSKVATRDDVHTAAHLAHLRLHDQRIEIMQRCDGEEAGA